MAKKREHCEEGYEWVYCRSFVHWKTGKRIFPKKGEVFRFKAKKKSA